MNTCGKRQRFPMEISIRNNGFDFEHEEAYNPAKLAWFHMTANEQPVKEITKKAFTNIKLRGMYQAKKLCFLDFFFNYNYLDEDPAVIEKANRNKNKPDGLGMRTDLNGNESVAFVFDYKATHRIPMEFLAAALGKETLFTESLEWIRANKNSTEPMVREREETRIAIALIQVFNYMLWYGVSYGYIANGKSLVFLHYDQAEPLALRWHLCIPDQMATRATAEIQITQVPQTSVAQLASFCFLSLLSPALTGYKYHNAMDHAQSVLQKWTSVTTKGKSDTEKGHEEAEDQHRQENNSSRKSNYDVPKKPTRPYCTQACLFGLKKGLALDMECPNVTSHENQPDTQHPINATEFIKLLSDQLQLNPYQGCEVQLEKCGSSGILMKVELVEFGYTFVGKCSVSQHPERLLHEHNIYKRLEGLQGIVVPLMLGMVSFKPSGHILRGNAYMRHLLLMSWVGEWVTEKMKSVTEQDRNQLLKRVYNYGVCH